MKVKKKTSQKTSAAEKRFDRDLKSCMKCHYFWGNDSRCMNSKCYKEKKNAEKIEPHKASKCTGCPYKQSELYCFPCMKEIVEKKENEKNVESKI